MPRRKKKPSISQLLLKQERKRGGVSCKTCEVPQWATTIKEALEAIDKALSEFDPEKSGEDAERLCTATSTQLHTSLSEQYAELEIPQYTLSQAALLGHIRRCERELWDGIQEKRVAHGFGSRLQSQKRNR